MSFKMGDELKVAAKVGSNWWEATRVVTGEVSVNTFHPLTLSACLV
jgi:hypothetical protein